MLTNIFENRDSKLKKIFSLADSLGRSLRKGVELFEIDGSKITFLTEDTKIIRGQYDGENLTEIEVEDGAVLSDPELFDKFVQSKVNEFVDSLREDKFSDANSKFSNVLKSWHQVAAFDRIKYKLQDKIANLFPQSKMIESPEFKKLSDIKTILIEYLKENKENILTKEQIVNSVLLSNKISKAFDIPKTTYEDLKTSKTYSTPNSNYGPIYEILCKQELIKKELLEAKENMENIWASDDDIVLLSTKLYEEDQSVLESTVAKIVTKIPYFAFASKLQISRLVENCLNLQDTDINHSDIKTFASNIFEIKKPIRDELGKLLTKKYGISIQNLKETPSLKSLQNSIVTIFESLSKVCNSKQVIKDTLKEYADFLKTKTGVEILDVNDFLFETFTQAGYPMDENNILQYMDFNKVADDVLKIGTVLKMIQQSSQPQLGQTAPQMGVPTAATPAQTIPQAPMTAPGVTTPNVPGGGVPDEQYPSDETTQGMGNTAGNPVASAQGAKMDMQNSMQNGSQSTDPQPNAPVPMDQNNLIQQLSVLDQLLQDLSFQLGRQSGAEGGPMAGNPGEEQGIPGEEGGIPGEEGEGMEGEGGEDFSGGDEETPDGPGGKEDDEEIEYVDMTKEKGNKPDSQPNKKSPPKKESKKPSKE